MAYTWKKVVNDTPIRYNPLSGDVTVEGGSYYSLVAVNTDANSDSRKYGYTEKRIDFYSNKDDSKLDGDVVQVLIEATDSYIEGKKLTYILENHDPGDSGTAEVQGNPVIWEADSSTGNLRWWWEDSATGEKDGEIELLLTFYEDILDCNVTYFDIPEGGAIEETEDHKFAVEWDSIAVGSKATPYDPSGYTENKTTKIVAKGHLAEDSDLSYVTFDGVAPGKEEFDAALATPVGENMPFNIYKNNDTNQHTVVKLATEFEEKVPGELYYAKGNTASTNQEVWIMGIYNQEYDIYGFYMSPAQYAADSPSDYSNWKNKATATVGGANFSVSCPSDSTISEVWYNPDDKSAIVIPTMYVQETYCSVTTGGVDLYGTNGEVLRANAPMERYKNLDAAPEKYSGGGAAGDTYVYNIIDDYYAYLSDAELDGEPTTEPTINYKYATEWNDASIGDDVSDYDETVHPNTTKLEVSEKKVDTNTGLNIIGLLPSGGGDLLYYCYVACETNKDGYVHAYVTALSPENPENLDTFLAMLDSANSAAIYSGNLTTSAYGLFGNPSYFNVLTDDGTANKEYTEDDWTKVTDYCYAMKVRYNKNFAGYYNIIMIYNPSYGRWCRWAQEVDESHIYKPMVTYAENDGGHNAMTNYSHYEYIDTCDGSRVYWHETLERVIVLPDETTNAALIAAGFNLTWYTGWSDTDLDAAVSCPWNSWESMISAHDQTIEDNFMGMLDRVPARPTKNGGSSDPEPSFDWDSITDDSNVWPDAPIAPVVEANRIRGYATNIGIHNNGGPYFDLTTGTYCETDTELISFLQSSGGVLPKGQNYHLSLKFCVDPQLISSSYVIPIFVLDTIWSDKSINNDVPSNLKYYHQVSTEAEPFGKIYTLEGDFTAPGATTDIALIIADNSSPVTAHVANNLAKVMWEITW